MHSLAMSSLLVPIQYVAMLVPLWPVALIWFVRILADPCCYVSHAAVILLTRTGATCRFLMVVLGTLTCVSAATIGFFQNNAKRVIAYSTCSHLGYTWSATDGAFAYGLLGFGLLGCGGVGALVFLDLGWKGCLPLSLALWLWNHTFVSVGDLS